MGLEGVPPVNTCTIGVPTGIPFFSNCKDNVEVPYAWNVTPNPVMPEVEGTANTKPVAVRTSVLLPSTYVTVMTRSFAEIVAVPLVTAALTWIARSCPFTFNVVSVAPH